MTQISLVIREIPSTYSVQLPAERGYVFDIILYYIILYYIILYYIILYYIILYYIILYYIILYYIILYYIIFYFILFYYIKYLLQLGFHSMAVVGKLYKNRKETAIYERINNKHRLHTRENKHTS